MNIFALSDNAEEAARWHMDRHVVKMPLESAQMLCTALHLHGHAAKYKPAHPKHPCTLWSALNRENYIWLCGFGLELCREYTYRYGRRHASEDVINACMDRSGLLNPGVRTEFAQAMPDEYKNPCPILAYREYYRKGKSHLAVWSKRDIPCWYIEHTLVETSPLL